jgi:hypothetical protein
MTEPVNSKIAKLLKEKKFNEPCLLYWKDLNLEGHRFKDWNNETIGDSPMHKRNAGYYSAPTISEVVMWLYKNRGIWIGVKPSYDGIEWYSEMFTASEQSWNDKDKRHSINTAFRDYNSIHNSPTEAYEAAIEYALNTLI